MNTVKHVMRLASWAVAHKIVRRSGPSQQWTEKDSHLFHTLDTHTGDQLHTDLKGTREEQCCNVLAKYNQGTMCGSECKRMCNRNER
jgi:hypothetical protein